MSNITFIFPLFNLSEHDRLDKLSRAVASVEGQGHLVFVGKKEDLDLVTAGGTKIVNTTDNLTYPAQVMLGVKAVDTEYFSVVEHLVV